MEISSAGNNQKIAVVQFESLVKRLPSTKAVYASLEQISKKYQVQLERMAKEGQLKFEEIQSRANTLDSPKRKLLEEELMDIQRGIQTVQALCEQELQAKQHENVIIAESLVKIIVKYGKEHKFTGIFYETVPGSSSAVTDITESIAKQLNLPKDEVTV